MALNFYTMNDENIFVFNNHTQSNASATGSVWVGGNALYNNYSVGADLPTKTENYYFALRVTKDMNITGGINHSRNSGTADDTGTVTKYTMTNSNNVPKQPLPYQFGVISLQAMISYLQCSSIAWANYVSTPSTQSISGTALTLTGTDANINTFLIDGNNVSNSSLNISAITSVNIVVPSGSTVVISIYGNNITLNNFTTLFNGVPITKAQAAYVLWNLPDATTVLVNSDIYGSFLAPYAIVNTNPVHIYGTVLVNTLNGSLNAVNNLFVGSLPDIYDPSTSGSCSSFTTT
ncbi:MAG: choice-of-anchor A family protein, partial [Bacilli bacterium]